MLSSSNNIDDKQNGLYFTVFNEGTYLESFPPTFEMCYWTCVCGLLVAVNRQAGLKHQGELQHVVKRCNTTHFKVSLKSCWQSHYQMVIHCKIQKCFINVYNTIFYIVWRLNRNLNCLNRVRFGIFPLNLIQCCPNSSPAARKYFNFQ